MSGETGVPRYNFTYDFRDFSPMAMVRVAAHGLKTLVFMIINFTISLICKCVSYMNYTAPRETVFPLT